MKVIKINADDMIPKLLRCFRCDHIVFATKKNSTNYDFFCSCCQLFINWKKGSIIERMKISEDQLALIATYYINNKRMQDLFTHFRSYSKENLSYHTIKKYYRIFYRIVLNFYLNFLEESVFENEIEIDECHLFRPKKSFAKIRGYRNQAVWIFGMKCRNNGKALIVPVVRRTAKILLPLIAKHIKPGSTIYSDSYSVYVTRSQNGSIPKSKLTKFGYIHFFVNHRYEFANKLFRYIHTNSIERLWRDVRQMFKITRSTSLYLVIVARFIFHREVETKEKMRILAEGLLKKKLLTIKSI